jgi:hypothetical protein
MYHLSLSARYVLGFPLGLVTAALVVAGCSGPRASTPIPGDVVSPASYPVRIDSVLRAELLTLAQADQAAREGFGAAAAANDTVYLKRLLASDSARTLRLKEIVQVYGWPTSALVGRDGADAAWLLLQHSGDVAWQERLLPLLEVQAQAGELPLSSVALLTDRVLVGLGRPQRYGSQFSLVESRLVAHPIEDFAGLEARRAAMGLQPMAEYVKMLAEAYDALVEWPPRR